MVIKEGRPTPEPTRTEGRALTDDAMIQARSLLLTFFGEFEKHGDTLRADLCARKIKLLDTALTPADADAEGYGKLAGIDIVLGIVGALLFVGFAWSVIKGHP
jgi:hypothetical protein